MTQATANASHQRWLHLLAQLDPETLTDALLPLVEQVDGYDQPPIPKSEIKRTALLSFDAILAGLRTEGLADAIAVAEEMGVSRARAGVQLSSLLTAIRLDFAVLWDALTEIAGGSDAEVIVHYTRTVLRTVDEFVGQAQRAFLAEDQRMRAESASRQGELVEALLRRPQSNDDQLDELARELGIPVDAPLMIVAAVHDDIAGLRVGTAELHRLGVPFFTHHLDGAAIAFAPHRAGSVTHAEAVEARVARMRVGLALADGGLAGLRDAAVQAGALARLLLPGEAGAMTGERGWARQAARSLHEKGTPVLADVNRALDQCTEAKRHRLLEAVHSYLDTGSISESAKRLFCHRNTLAKQLHQFAEITGIDPTVPRQAARLVVGWA